MWADQDFPEPELSFTDMTPEREVLMAIYDRLGLVINATVVTAGNGNKPLKLDSYPRPVSAIDKARARRFDRTRETFILRLQALQERPEG